MHYPVQVSDTATGRLGAPPHQLTPLLDLAQLGRLDLVDEAADVSFLGTNGLDLMRAMLWVTSASANVSAAHDGFWPVSANSCWLKRGR